MNIKYRDLEQKDIDKNGNFKLLGTTRALVDEHHDEFIEHFGDMSYNTETKKVTQQKRKSKDARILGDKKQFAYSAPKGNLPKFIADNSGKISVSNIVKFFSRVLDGTEYNIEPDEHGDSKNSNIAALVNEEEVEHPCNTIIRSVNWLAKHSPQWLMEHGQPIYNRVLELRKEANQI